MRHTLWTGISETNVNVITSATRTHAFNNNNNNNNIETFSFTHNLFYFGGNPWQFSYSASSFMKPALGCPNFQTVFEYIPNVLDG